MMRGRKAGLHKLSKQMLARRRWTSAVLVAVCLLALLSVSGNHWRVQAATNWYVSLTGNNNNLGTISAPFQTLSRAIEAASSGDTIFVFDGIYTNPANFITIDKDVTIQGFSSLAIFNVGTSMGISPNRPYFTIAPGRKVTIRNIIFNGNPIEYNPPRSCHIEVQPNANVTVDACFFRKGQPINSTGQVTRGGSINNAGTLTVTNSNFENNQADEGGAIYNSGMLTVGSNNNFDNSSIANAGTLILNNSLLKNRHGASPALVNSGTATVANARFVDNHVTNSGSAIVNASGGTLRLVNSELFGNRADQSGGAIVNASGSKLTITNSTFYGNSSTQFGGGIQNAGTLEINFCTLANNSAATGGGGGIYNSSTGTLKLKNSIVANNPMGGDFANESGGTFIALGKNFDTDGSGAALDSEVQQVTAPQLNLSALGFNGGPTNTIALGMGSIAIDAAPDCVEIDGITPVNKDQRSQFRCQCDVGAYEVTPPPANAQPSITTLPNQIGVTNGVAATAQVSYPEPIVYCAANLVCNPPSGTAFPLGTTTVTCTANNGAGLQTSTSFNVLVRTPRAAITNLKTQVQALVPATLTQMQANSLISYLDLAGTHLEQGNKQTACTDLANFIAKCNAFGPVPGSGPMNAAQRDNLISYANKIRSALGVCGG